jgi:hypothetical protein
MTVCGNQANRAGSRKRRGPRRAHARGAAAGGHCCLRLRQPTTSPCRRGGSARAASVSARVRQVSRAAAMSVPLPRLRAAPVVGPLPPGAVPVAAVTRRERSLPGRVATSLWLPVTAGPLVPARSAVDAVIRRTRPHLGEDPQRPCAPAFIAAPVKSAVSVNAVTRRERLLSARVRHVHACHRRSTRARSVHCRRSDSEHAASCRCQSSPSPSAPVSSRFAASLRGRLLSRVHAPWATR